MDPPDLRGYVELALRGGLAAAGRWWAECGPIAGETPPVAAPAGRGAHRAVVVGVGNASTAGVASRQKFNSADLTWLSAVK